VRHTSGGLLRRSAAGAILPDGLAAKIFQQVAQYRRAIATWMDIGLRDTQQRCRCFQRGSRSMLKTGFLSFLRRVNSELATRTLPHIQGRSSMRQNVAIARADYGVASAANRRNRMSRTPRD
jgi:hypothetical protein